MEATNERSRLYSTVVAVRARTRLLCLLALLLGASGSNAHGQTANVTWTRVGPENLTVGKVVIDPRDPRVFYAVGSLCTNLPSGGCQGILKSQDRGESWKAVLQTSATLVVLDSVVSPSALFAATLTHYENLVRSLDGGETWSALFVDSFNCYSPFGLATPTPPRALYFERDCFSSRNLTKSSDGGESWRYLSVFLNAFAIAPSNPNVLYGVRAGYGDTFPDGVFASADGGESWTVVNSSTQSSTQILAVDPLVSATVYNGTSFPAEVFRSTDGGRNWLASSTGIGATRVSDLVIDPSSPSTLYAVTDSGLFRSTDSAISWIRVNDPSGSTLGFVTLDPLAPSTVFASSDGKLFRATFADAGSCTPSRTAICLGSGRFRVSVLWESASGGVHQGTAAPITSNTGAFWFFDAANLEPVVKVLDGRSINGKFWVFYGALSNVEYTITVTDTQTGAVKTYFNPQGQLASVADISAF